MRLSGNLITLLLLCCPLFAASEGDTIKSVARVNPPVEKAVVKADQKYMNDLIQMKSRERIRCSIEKEDSLSLYIDKAKSDGALESAVINKSEVDYFQYDYFLNNLSEVTPPNSIEKKDPRVTITLGLLQAGGFIGADLAFAVVDHIGLQVGAGLFGYDIGINYHFGKSINSSSIGIIARNQLIYFNGVGPVFTYRGNGYSFQIGYCLYFTDHWPPNNKKSPYRAYQKAVISFGGYVTLW